MSFVIVPSAQPLNSSSSHHPHQPLYQSIPRPHPRRASFARSAVTIETLQHLAEGVVDGVQHILHPTPTRQPVDNMPGEDTPEVGDTVSWQYGGSHPSGELVEKKAEGEIAINSKRGNTIKRKGTPSDPATHVARDGNDVVKKQSELEVEEKGSGSATDGAMAKGEASKADEDQGIANGEKEEPKSAKKGEKRKATAEPEDEGETPAKKARGRPKKGEGEPSAKKEKPAAKKAQAKTPTKAKKEVKTPKKADKADGEKKSRGRPKKDGSAPATKSAGVKKAKTKAPPVKGSVGTRTRSTK